MIETGIISKVKIQDVISNQLPEFIKEESPDTIDFLKQYYTSQEYQGGPSDISDNLEQYLNVNNLTPEVIVDSSITVGLTTVGEKTINVSSTKGFPNHYGLLKIGNEIITYTDSTPTSFIGCKRGFSGITSYHSDTNKEDLVFNSSSAAEHEESSTVQNLSSLFLKEFYKKFKTTFLPGLEETDFQSSLDVGTFIGEARSLYQTKGTDESFRILFNVLYGIDPKIINLEDRLIKPSFATYVRRRVCVAELLEGNPVKLKGQTLLKGLTGQTLFRSDLDVNINAAISEIEPFERIDSGVSGITTYYKIGLFVGYDENTDIEGDFVVVPNTKSLETVSAGSSIISVDSTIGFGVTGTIISGSNTINYTDKTVNQFLGCTATSTGSFNDSIEPTTNIRSNITYFGFEDGDLNKKVVLRLTGVLSDFKQIGKIDVEEGEVLSVKSIGDKVENPKINKTNKEIFCNSWIYNTSSSYFVDRKDDGNNIFLKSKIDRSSLKKGDKVDILNRRTNKVEDSRVISSISEEENSINISSNFDFNNDNYKIRKQLNKASSIGAPIEYGNDVIISDVQNVYTENDNAYVTSNSLPSFINSTSEFSKQIDLNITKSEVTSPSDVNFLGDSGDKLDFTTIKFNTDVKFKTGDKVFYSSQGDTLVGLETGTYFVKVENDGNDPRKIKLFGSPSGIDNNQIITFAVSENPSTHTFILDSQKSGQIGAQKLIKKFPLTPNLFNGVDESTPVGEIGMLINGVEITNYKTNDKVYFGPLSSVDVLNGGEDFDIIDLPNITISTGAGITALAQPVVSGKIVDVFVDPQDFDVDKVISIGVTGGNGSECVLEPILDTRFREKLFNAQPSDGSSAGITTITVDNTISSIIFSSDHNFINDEPIIYDSNSNPEIIIGTGTDTLVNGATYYPQFINSKTIRLYESSSDLSAGIGTIAFHKESTGTHIFKVGIKNTLLDVKVIDGGKNYTNRKLFVKPAGISTSTDSINFKNHGFKEGDLIEYSGNISGLNSTKNYNILFNDIDSFSLSDVGVGATDISNYVRRKRVNLRDQGTGFQEFKYPEIKVTTEINEIVGIGTTTIKVGLTSSIESVVKARGSIQQIYLYESGTGYGSSIINNHKKPIITLSNGKNASLSPNIINGQIESVIINSTGKDYFSTPDIEIIDPKGKGSGAKIRPVIKNNRIDSVVITNKGLGYSDDTSINVISAGKNHFLDSQVRSLTMIVNDDNNQLLQDSSNKLKYSVTGYDQSFIGIGNSNSDLIGWAYDGNPIYGPFGSSNPLDTSDLKTQLISGYVSSLNNIEDRPDDAIFELGTFVEDYKFENSGDLDEHNGRFEITKEFPNGTYVYHATIKDGTNNPSFPFFIGNTFRSKSIDFNFENNLQTNFDFNSNNLLRNTLPYKVSDDNANNDFIVETNEIQDQKIEITSVSSGSITGFDIISGGSDYKVGEFLKFDNEDNQGDNLVSFISKVDGKNISSITTEIEENNNSVITWSDGTINVFTQTNHNLKNNDIVRISGLSTDISSLNNSFKIGVTTSTTTTISTISGSPSAGFTTEIFVSNIPDSVSVGSSIGIGTETLGILNIYRNLNILTIQRDSDSSFGTTHPKGSNVSYLTNKFTINKSIPVFESQVNQKVFFNPSQTVGLGTDDGTENTLSFSFAGKNITRNVPVKQIHIENHPFKTNQKIKFTSPSGNIVISNDNNITSFNLPQDLFVVNKNINSIGIKTQINSDEVHFITVPSVSENLRDKFLFETVFDQVTAKVERIKTIVKTTESHDLKNDDNISLLVNPSLSVGIGTSTAVRVSRDLLTGNILINPVGFNSTAINITNNLINIQNHELKTGDKVKYQSDLLPDGLENKNYFVYKVDDNNLKLSETLSDISKNIPITVGIGSTGGSTQSLSLINPQLRSIKNNNLVFDLSDSSLTGYEFKIYYDNLFKNEFISDGKNTTFNIITSGVNGSVGATLTIGYGNSLPNRLFYNLEKTGFISTSDTEVKNNSQISFDNSAYSGSYNISGVGATTFEIFLNNVPEKLVYNSTDGNIKYATSSKNVKGSINSINIISSGSNYKKIPNFVGVGTISQGSGASIIPTSSNIGNVEEIRVINEGFEYSSDKTLEPESLISSSVDIKNTNTLGIVSVTQGGANYVDPPDIIIVDSDTGEEIKTGFIEPIMLENSIFSVNITEKPIGLPSNKVTLRTINNTNGIVITDVVSNGSGIFTCKIATPPSKFAIEPFSINDTVFIEGIEKFSTDGDGFNSKDYGFKLLTVSDFDQSNIPAEVTIDVSELTTNTGIAKTVVETFATVINKSDYPEFFITQNQSTFEIGEKLRRKNNVGSFSVVRVDNGKLKILDRSDLLRIDDVLIGETSGSQCTVSKITKNVARLKTDFSILKNLNWGDDTGKLSEDFQVVSNNDYYQNMSYSVQSPIEWKKLRTPVNNLIHTSGMKNFADTSILSDAVVGVGSDSDVNIVIDVINEKRVDEIRNIDLVSDAEPIVDNTSRFVKFENIRLTDFVSCKTNDVLTIDDINQEFTNLQGNANEFLDIFEFSNSTSSRLFNNLIIITKSSSGTNRIQISDLILLSNGTKNVLVEKSNLINSGIGLTNTEDNNFVDFTLSKDVSSKVISGKSTIVETNTLRFAPVPAADADYDLKIFSTQFNQNTIGFGSTSIGPIDLNSSNQSCNAGITTNIITLPIDKFESIYATIQVIDDSTKEMNLVETFVSHSGTDTFLTEAYFNTDDNNLSLNKLGIITSSISGNNLILSLENSGSNTLNLRSKIIGIGTTGVSNDTYRFKTTGQVDGSERTSIYSGLSSTNVGISTLISLNSSGFNAVKSVVEVSIGASKAIHEVLSLHDGVDAYVQQSGSLSITKGSLTEYDPSVGLGTFSASLSGSNFNIKFHPDDNVGVSTIISLNHAFYTQIDQENDPEELIYGVITEDNSFKLYTSAVGNRIEKTQFKINNNSTPIFAKTFNPSDTNILDPVTGKFSIQNSFFRENEELIYKPKSTFIGIGSTPMQFKDGIVVDTLPTTVFAKNVGVGGTSFFISTTRAGAAVTFVGLGEGNAHEFSMAKANEKALITIDDVAQYPLIRNNVTHTLDSNSGGVGLSTTIIHLSGISTISTNDVLKINSEFMEVVNVGFATTGGAPVGTSGTFNTVEVKRAFVGTSATTHLNGDNATIFRGSYNIVGKDIFFTKAPRGDITKTKTINDLNPPTSNFSGRVYLRNNYDSNVIYDDISDQFTGINSTFTLKVGGANTIGIGTTGGSGILFINGIFQSPSTQFNTGKNFRIIESGSGASGVSSVVFTGITSSDGSVFSSNNINMNELPRGGVPVAIGNTINGLGYAPLVNANVKALFNSSGQITSIVGTAFSGSDLGIQTATYDNTTGIITFTTVEEHRFRNANDFVLIDNLSFDPSIDFIRSNEYAVVSVAATNVFGISIGSSTVSHAYQGSGKLYPFFPNLTFGSGYNGLSPIGVAVTDLGYEHRFISANTNAITHSNGGSFTPTDAVYDPVTGELRITVTNHGLDTSDTVNITVGSLFFSCSRDNFRTVHPYPRPTNTTVVGNNRPITKFSSDTFTVDVGKNVGNGAQVTATVGVGGTLIFAIDDEGTDYKDPIVSVSLPSYSNLSVTGVSRLGLGSTTDTGTDLRVNAIVKPVTGIGSTLFEVSEYEIVNRGFGFKKGDVVEAVGLVTSKNVPNLLEKSTLTIDKIYNDSFALWQFGDFDYIDSIKDEQNGKRTEFSLLLNNQLISFELGSTLNVNVSKENLFLVVINGVIQEPTTSYTIVGGNIISFTEAPVPEDDVTILFYKGTQDEDSEVNLKQKLTIEEGDEIQITQGSGVEAQGKRTVFNLNTSQKLETNPYLLQGVNSTVSRSLNLIKQKVDKIINKSPVSKKRSSIEPRISPISKVIGDVETGDTSIYLDNIDLFKYDFADNDQPDLSFELTNKDQFNSVNASATATVSAAGTISGLTITNQGSGYTNTPTVKILEPTVGVGSFIKSDGSVGFGTTATATATISNGQVNNILVSNPGLRYTISPTVIIESPINYSNSFENITFKNSEVSTNIQSNVGVVTGIGTTTTASSKLGITFTLKRTNVAVGDTFGLDSPIEVGKPIYIFDTRIGTGVTSISNSGSDTDVVGIGESFIDNVYIVESLTEDKPTSGSGIITCLIKSNTITTGISTFGTDSFPVGKYSVGIVKSLTRGSNPISIGVTGLTVGLVTATGISTFPILKRSGGSGTFEQSGAIIPEIRPT